MDLELTPDGNFHLSLLDKHGEDRAKSILSSVYGEEKTERITQEIGHVPESILPSCFDCEKCSLSSTCEYDQFKEVYLNYSREVDTTSIDQARLADLF